MLMAVSEISALLPKNLTKKQLCIWIILYISSIIQEKGQLINMTAILGQMIKDKTQMSDQN